LLCCCISAKKNLTHLTSNTIQWSDELYNIFEVENYNITQFYEDFISKVHEEDKQKVLEANKNAREFGKPFDFDYRIKTKSGKIKYIREVGYATKSNKGNIVSLF